MLVASMLTRGADWGDDGLRVWLILFAVATITIAWRKLSRWTAVVDACICSSAGDSWTG